MDLEQLQLILDAARAAGDGAMQVVFVWFAYKFFVALLWASIGVSILVVFYKVAVRIEATHKFIAQIQTVVSEDLDYCGQQQRFIRWLRANYKVPQE